MGAMTIRGLDEMTIKALKDKAKQEGSSINTALLKILKKELGIEKKKHTVVYHDLDHLAGTRDKKDFAEFWKNVRSLRG